MTAVNPHWDVTDQPNAGAAATPTAPSHNTGLPTAVPRGSPRPAALFGVLLAVAVGVYSTVGLPWELTAQVNTSLVLAVSKTGFEPSLLTVSVGDSIAVRNSDTVAHTVELVNPIAGADPLFTITLQPRRAGMVEITDEMPTGIYMLTTTDAVPFIGQIIINPPDPNAVLSSSSSSRLTPPLSGRPVVIPPSAPIATFPSSTPAANGTDDPTPFVIEVNPYTVGSDFRPSAPYALTDSTFSSSSASSVVPVGTSADSNYRPGAPSAPRTTPPAIPKSGPELWLIGLLTLGGFWLLVRRALRFE